MKKQAKGRCIIQRFRLKFVFVWFVLSFFVVTLAGAQTVMDDHQRLITVSQPYKRIISLYGAHTDNLFHLGLDDEIIGVGMNERPSTGRKEKQTFSYHDDPEKFIAFSPDLVLIRPMIDNGYPALVRYLEKSGITVVSLQPSGIEQMYEYWVKLGVLTGRKAQAEQMVRQFQDKVARVRKQTLGIQPKKRVYVEAIHNRMKTFTSSAMPIFALETAGGINVALDASASRNTNIANFGKERILAKADQIDAFIAQVGVMNPVTIDQIRKEPGFHIIKAVKDNQILLIDENIVSRPVPGLFAGILRIGAFLYPDVFSPEFINRINNEH